MRKGSALLAFLLLLLSILTAILNLGLGSGYMAFLFEKNGDWSNVPFSEKASLAYASSITSYLSGQSKEWNFVFEGTNYGEIFSEEERLHMEDVRDIFLNIQFLFYICLLGFPFSAIYLRKKNRLQLFLVAKYLCYFLLILIAVIIFGIFNFRQLFVWMHEILFYNDNWILSKAKDIIINLMPLGFFVEMSIKLIWLSLYLMCIGMLFLVLLKKIKIKEKLYEYE